jgi:hypothetical protein
MPATSPSTALAATVTTPRMAKANRSLRFDLRPLSSFYFSLSTFYFACIVANTTAATVVQYTKEVTWRPPSAKRKASPEARVRANPTFARQECQMF